MKQKRTWIVSACIAVFLVGGIGLYQSAFADAVSTPGLANDPVVTKSYVDQKIAELTGKGPAPGSETSGGAEAALEVVKVPVGKKIMVAAGGELIVRTGKAVAFSPDTNGLSDMTDGLDIAPGKPVGNNHLILFPRDGRGVTNDLKSKIELIVIVRGGYQVQ